MSQSVWNELKSKRKSEWSTWVKDKTRQVRIWVQENGEAALGLGAFVGICFVLFFKLFIGLLVILGLISLIIWQFSPEDEVQTSTVDVKPEPEPEVEVVDESSDKDTKD